MENRNYNGRETITTIAYKDGVIAMDSRVTGDTVIYGHTTKGKATKDYLAAAAGGLQEVQAFLDWVDAGYKQEDKKKFGLEGREVEIQAIVVDKKKNIYFFEDRLYPFCVNAAFHALGSGTEIAMGAMAAGASAYSALKIASQYDSATGGPIKLLSFPKPLEKKIKKKVRK